MTTTHCETCGTKRRAGLCPGCMFRLALTSDPNEEIEDAPELPRYFADHEILGEIARGGMGVVYRARKLEIDRSVALKVVRTGSLATPDARMRFKLEVEAISKLRHPHIISLFETGEVDGVHFFSMPLAEKTLSRSSDLRGDVTLFKKMVSAVQYAHSRGILHRDIKPSNVLIDADGEPLLSDFGLVKHLGQDSSVTMTRAVMGSPGYMAPEQREGRELSTAADIYSLGAVLYELLTGEPPPDAAFGPSPRRKSSETPRDLAAICQCCLEPLPSDRYASAANLEEDLQRWLEGRPVVARSRSIMASVWLWARRSPGLAAMAAMTSLLVLALAIGSTVAALRISQAQDLATSRLQNLQLEEIENLETSGQTMESIAKLADYLGDHPEDELVRSQLLSALGHRSFPVNMETRKRRISSRLLDSMWTPQLITLEANGKLTEWSDPPSVQQLPKGTAGYLDRSANQALVLDGEGRIHHWQKGDGSDVLTNLPPPVDWAVAEDWTRLAIIDSKKNLSLWSLPDGELLESRPVERLFRQLVFSPDGKHLAGGDVDGHLMLWDTANLSGTELTHERWRRFADLAFSHDGSLLATGDRLGGIQIYTIPDGNPLTRPMRHGYLIHDLEFSDDDEFLLSASEMKEVRIWQVATGELHGQPARTTTGVQTVGFVKSEAPLRIGTVAHDGFVTEFEIRRPWLASDPLPISGRTARFEEYGTIPYPDPGTVFHAPTYPELETKMGILWRATVHPDGRHYAIAKRDGKVEIWNVQENRLLHTLRSPGGAPLHLAFHGNFLATATQHGRLSLWDWKSGKQSVPQPTLPSPARDLAFSPDGSKYLLSTARRVTVFETATAEILWEKRHSDFLFSSRFSPDGRQVVASGIDGIALVWKIGSEDAPQKFDHRAPLFHAAFSPCGSFLLTASYADTVRLWDVESGRPVTVPIPVPGEITGAGFVKGSSRVVTTSAGGYFQTWDVSGTTEALPLIELARAMNGDTLRERQKSRAALLEKSDKELTSWLFRSELGN